MRKPRIAITLGDPAGIGYEIACKFITAPEAIEYDLTLVGHRTFVKNTFENILHMSMPIDIKVLQPESCKNFPFTYGDHSAECGKSSMEYIKRAVEGTLSGEFDAIVTCPINKKSIQDAGYPFPGHTEYLASLAGTDDVSMMLVGGRIKVLFATTHCPLSQVADILNPDIIFKTIRNAHHAGKYFGTLRPKIALCALNPHAGDNGVLGNEETAVIQKAIDTAHINGYNVFGPYPSDTLFVNGAKWDFIIAMYHDQGMIPIKMESFGEAVNVSLNLPFVRTSVDHGTAFDIAGEGNASFSSLVQAVRLAESMVIYDQSFRSI